LVHGKVWSVDEEATLRGLVGEGLSTDEISEAMDKSRGSIKAKVFDLKLHVARRSSSVCEGGVVAAPFELFDDLPSIKEKMQVHDAAMRALEVPGLSKSEVLRLRTIMQGAEAYGRMFASFVNYKKLEVEVAALRRELEEQKRRNTP
jgi:hypothetical protein